MSPEKNAPAPPAKEARAASKPTPRRSKTSADGRLGQVALGLTEIGLRPVPCDSATKRPLVAWKQFQTKAPTIAEITAWWAKYPSASIGILTGHEGGLSALDFDVDESGKLPDWPPAPLELPTGCVLSTPRGGRHYLFRHIAGVRNSAGELASGVDVRGEGGLLIVAGPGREELFGSFEEALQTDAPDWLRALLLPDKTHKKTPLAGVPEGTSDDMLFRYAHDMRRRGVTKEEALVLMETAARQCTPPFSIEPAREKVERAYEGSTHDPLTRPIAVSEIPAEEVRWLWRGYIPRKKLTLIAGDPGAGKTFVLCDMIARITKGGRWPDGTEVSAAENVLFLVYEDGIGDTIRPRLEAAGAALDRVYVIHPAPTIERIHDLHQVLAEYRPAVIAVDPLNGYLNADANKAHEVRPGLQALASLAAMHDAAVIALHHLNKSGSGTGLSPLYRLLGSIEFGAVARSIIGVSRDRDGDRRVFTPIKSSLAPEESAYAFELAASKVRWIGPTTDTAEDGFDPEEGSAIREAVDYLVTTLNAGPVPSAEIMKEAARLGINDKTLRRAKTRLRIASPKIDNVWHWEKK